MFSSVGWGEILILVIVGIIVVGPERLPRIITDVKAMIHAARGAITSAKEELGDDFKEAFEDFRKPLSQINDMRRMGARGLVSKALLDDDPEFFRDIEASARGVSSAVTGQGGSTSASTRSTGASSQAPAASVESSAPAETTESSEASAAGDTTAAGQKKTDGGADWGAMDEGDVL
ncbi:MAG: Sec-independent protein translocase protein TatB [Corynebacterium variabile]|uniref:Sec-independent protein translocase protein TatB n=1 Tax=Corynebacterium variabile TaxID=1727 RepID=UPI0026483D7F|nr:Sec-independent protein translocase protein TatB [Corynebacterium variabile]MDN6535663.1 Sec-independent protein translocase protein TatB [Corynebacterium variabile]